MGISFYPVAFAAQITQHYREECARHGWQPTPEQLVYRCRIAVGEDAKEVETLRAGLIATAEGGLYTGRGGQVGDADRLGRPDAGQQREPGRVGQDRELARPGLDGLGAIQGGDGLTDPFLVDDPVAGSLRGK